MLYGFFCAIYVLARRAAVYFAVIVLGIISTFIFYWLGWRILRFLVF